MVPVRLVIEFESVISVRDVLFRLFLDFSVGFDPIKRHGAVVSVFCHSHLIIFKSLVIPCFPF